MKRAILLLIGLIFVAQNAMAQTTNEELKRRIDILAEEIQNLKASQLQIGTNTSMFGLSPSASKVYQIKKGISIGGYGEIVFTSPENENEAGSQVTGTSSSEVLRNIIYVGYKFDNQWTLNTEIEIEHVDEVFVEFAYLDYLANENFGARFGLLLLPMGLVNELHEPTLFYSVNRPEVENKIIPSTWRENGAGVYGQYDKFSYRAYIVNGLNGDGITRSGLRGGRKKGGAGSKTETSTGAFTGRFDFNVNNNLTVGGALYTGAASSTGGSIGVTIAQAHFIYKNDRFESRGLFVKADVDDEDNNNANFGTELEMEGAYIEFAYNLLSSSKKALKPFLRYEMLNTDKATSSNNANDKTNITVGLAYQPLQRIIFKADYVKKTTDTESGVDEINMGIGWNF